jgi:hypothetical protein
MSSVVRMNEGAGAGAGAYHVCRPRVVAIGEKNLRGPNLGDIGKALVARLYRIDAKVSLSMANEVTVEVVPVRLGKPRPGKNISGDFMHAAVSFQRAPVSWPARINCDCDNIL